MVPLSKKTSHPASSHNRDLNSQWLLKSCFMSLFDLITAKKKKEQMERKIKETILGVTEKRAQSQWIYQRPLRTSGNDDEGGKKCGDKGQKKSLVHKSTPWFQTWTSAMMNGGRRERKKKGQTNAWQTRTSCVSTSSSDWPEQRQCSTQSSWLSAIWCTGAPGSHSWFFERLLAESDSSGRACVCDVDVTIPADSQNRKPQHEKTEKRKGRGRETGTNVWHEK